MVGRPLFRTYHVPEERLSLVTGTPGSISSGGACVLISERLSPDNSDLRTSFVDSSPKGSDGRPSWGVSLSPEALWSLALSFPDLFLSTLRLVGSCFCVTNSKLP